MENHLSTLIPDLDWPYHLDVTPNAHTLVMLKFQQLSQQAQMAYTLLPVNTLVYIPEIPVQRRDKYIYIKPLYRENASPCDISHFPGQSLGHEMRGTDDVRAPFCLQLLTKLYIV